MLMTARARTAAPTYLMQRRHLLLPPLATSVNGTQAWTAGATLLGGGKTLSENTNGNYLQFANRPFAAGTWDHRVLFERSTNRGIIDGRIGAADLTQIDLAGATAANTLATSSFAVGARTLDYFRQVVDGTNNSFYYQPPQFMELVKTSDGNDWGSGPEDLPWYQDIPPWFMEGGTMTWAGNYDSYFGGVTGWFGNGTTRTLSIFCPATAAYQLAVRYSTLSNRGIADISVDGGSVLGSIDQYSAGSVPRASTTVSLGTLSAGWHTVTFTMNGKNASSSSYNLFWSWFQLQRTTTGTCPAGVNGPEQVLLLPTFSDSETGTWTLSISVNQALYGWMYAVTASASKSWSANLKAGTYRARVCGVRYSDGATTVTVKLNGSSVGTFSQNGATSYSHVWDVTGITVPTDGKHTFLLELTAGTTIYLGSVLLERTGD